jgi:flavin-dependent dehydrogenase
MDALLSSGAANWKHHVTIFRADGGHRTYEPGAWLARPPWNVEVRTLHLDRQQTQSITAAMAAELGIRILHESAVAVQQVGDRIVSVQTSASRGIHASWFIDASGAASSLLARHFQLRSCTYGPRKVALWAHLAVEDRGDGTILHMPAPSSEYMEWLWEIPIRPGVSSVGYVLSGHAMKRKRAGGMTNAEVFQDALRPFPRLSKLVDANPGIQPCSTSFLCRSYRDTCGPNWMIVGEAASQSDPITGNGVTAALRHAEEGAAILLRYRNQRRIPLASRRAYSLRVLEMGRFFNSLIEKMFYQPPLRSHIGVLAVARAYTVPAWLANLIYSRVEPAGLPQSMAFGSALASLRAAAWTAHRVTSCLPYRMDPAQPDILSVRFRNEVPLGARSHESRRTPT